MRQLLTFESPGEGGDGVGGSCVEGGGGEVGFVFAEDLWGVRGGGLGDEGLEGLEGGGGRGGGGGLKVFIRERSSVLACSLVPNPHTGTTTTHPLIVHPCSYSRCLTLTVLKTKILLPSSAKHAT